MLKMPAAIWRPEHIAVAQMLLSGRGEWGQTGILEKRKKAGTKKVEASAAGKTSGSGSEHSRVDAIITAL